MSRPMYYWLIALIVVAVIAIAGVSAVLVAARPAPTPVPNVVLLPLAQATALIEHAGLSLGSTSRLATASVGDGRVMVQRPASSTMVARGSSVDVTIAVAPARVAVPDVVGGDAALATQKLTDALFLPVTVDVFVTSPSRGTVIDQVPSPGTPWLTGRQVAIGVAAGPDTGAGVKVPNLSGKTVDVALSELKAAGFDGRGFVMGLHSPVPNVVVDQLPPAGALVRHGTTVLVLFNAP
jgi:eukaryotic-like serine/threonine-protein kinase